MEIRCLSNGQAGFVIVHFGFPEYFPVADGMYALLGRLDFMIVGLIFLDKFPWGYWLLVHTRLNSDLSCMVSAFTDASFFLIKTTLKISSP